MDKRKKTRQGDSTLIDIRTFVRHMSALILGVRDEYHQVHILIGGGGCSNLMEDVFDAETCSLRVIFFSFLFLCCQTHSTTLREVVFILNTMFSEPVKAFQMSL